MTTRKCVWMLAAGLFCVSVVQAEGGQRPSKKARVDTPAAAQAVPQLSRPLMQATAPPRGTLTPGRTAARAERQPAEAQVLTGAQGTRGFPPDPCIVVDDGTGTVSLPPEGCEYLSPTEVHEIIDGLPIGTTIILDTIHLDFICRQGGSPEHCGTPGGNLGGEVETFDSNLHLEMTGTGDLAGNTWTFDIQAVCTTHTGPRNPGDPVQTFPTDMFSLEGSLSGDPDFDLLSIRAGTLFGLPSAGQTTLTDQGDGTFQVDSFFDVSYEIDFVGNPGGVLGGMQGTTSATLRMEAGAPSGGCTKIAPAGDDCFTTPCDGTTSFDFVSTPIPAGFFYAGSPAFSGVVDLGGPGGFPGDTIIQRLGDMCFDVQGVEQTVPIQIIQLNLLSCAPIDVGGLLFDAYVNLDPNNPSPPGTLSATKTHANGGTFYVNPLPVNVEFWFVPAGDPAPPPGLGPVLAQTQLQTVADGTWLQSCCDTGCGSTGFFPGWDEDPNNPTNPYCCKPVCHAAGPGYPPGHQHCVWPPDCQQCPWTGGGPDGACCDKSGACIGDMTESACVSQGFKWHPNASCGADPTLPQPMCQVHGCDYDNGQPLDDFGAPASQYDGLPAEVFSAEAADDFILKDSGNNLCHISDVQFWVTHFNTPAGIIPDPATQWTGVTITIYDDAAPKQPSGNRLDNGTFTGTVVATQTVPMALVGAAPWTTVCITSVFQINVPVDFLLEKNHKYWIVMQPNLDRTDDPAGGPGYGQVAVMLSQNNSGHAAQQIFPLAGLPAWIEITGNVGSGGPCNLLDPGSRRDLAFNLIGDKPCAKVAPAGDDCWTTACGAGTAVEFGSPDIPTIPADFFAPGSDPFTGVVELGGQSGFIDTMVARLNDMCFDGAVPVTAVTDIEIVQLSLISCAPITVTYNGGQDPEQWDVQVFLDGPQPQGTLIATKLDASGGTFDTNLPILPGFNFTGPGGLVATLPALNVLWLNSTGLPWMQTAPPIPPQCGNGGFFPGYSPADPTCCDWSCHAGPAPGHDHCVLPPECTKCSCKDFEVTAPGSWAGTTCGAGDDCSLRPTEDITYTVTLPNDGNWHFSLCDSAFDTYMYIETACCLGDLAENDDYDCDGDGTFELQSGAKVQLPAGTYWVTIEGYGAGMCGNYVLDIFKWPDCDKPSPAAVDCWATECDGDTVFDFGLTPIPAGFFGPGSEPFADAVAVGGASGFIDTQVARLNDMCFDGITPVTEQTPIQIVQLDLAACQPVTVSFSGGSQPCLPGDENAIITIEIMTDNFGSETTWELVDKSAGVVASGGPYPNATLIVVDVPVCSYACYNFTIFDSFGDGICCAFGNGFYNVFYDGNLVGSGGQFGSSETVSDIGGGCASTEDWTMRVFPDGPQPEGTLTATKVNRDGGTFDSDLQVRPGFEFTGPGGTPVLTFLPGQVMTLSSAGLPWLYTTPPAVIPGCSEGGGFHPGYSKLDQTCCEPSCHADPAGGHDHCVFPPECPHCLMCKCPGDVNADGVLDGRDIAGFVRCLTGVPIPDDDCYCADMDGDGVGTMLDVQPFVDAILFKNPCPDNNWFWKDYNGTAPGGYMPDYDQNKDYDNADGDNNPQTGVDPNYCGPTAVGNSLWWFDHKFPDAGVVPPGNTKIDLIQELAQDMATNGQTPSPNGWPPPYPGTYVDDMASGINAYLTRYALTNLFYQHTEWQPGFQFIAEEVQRSQDVVLLVGFYHVEQVVFIPPNLYQIFWRRVGGHYITVAGVNKETLEIAVSDPDADAAEFGFPGVVRPAGVDHDHDGDADPTTTAGFRTAVYDHTVHNDKDMASHDYYALQPSFSPGGNWALVQGGDPLVYAGDLFDPDSMVSVHEFDNGGEWDASPTLVDEDFLMANGYPIPEVCQTYTEIEYAVLVSPYKPCTKAAEVADDCWYTECGNGTAVEFGSPEIPPIPADFFNPGSDPFTGTVELGGASGVFDTVVSRLDEMCFDGDPPITSTSPIEIAQLDLVSCTSITVTYNGGQTPEQWDLALFLDGAQDQGKMTAVKLNPDGGTFSADLPVTPGFRFTNLGGDVRTLLPQTVLTLSSIDVPWSHYPPPDPIPAGCSDTGHFYAGWSKDAFECCEWSCHAGPSPGHDHCVMPPGCQKCAPDCKDFTVTAPGTWPGTTCGAGDDCTLQLTEDHVYSVTIPNDGNWHFSLCDSAFDTYMYIGTACCNGDIGEDDNGCALALGQSELKATLTAGTYWVTIEGAVAGECGNYILDIFEWTTCGKPAPAGDDCWTTQCDGSSGYDFTTAPIPADFFGPGSDPFASPVVLGGQTGFIDTTVSRLGDMCFDGGLPVTDTVPIELVQLDLISCQPITVTYSGPPFVEQWDVKVVLEPVQPQGAITAIKTQPEGGTFDTILPMDLRFDLTPTLGGPTLTFPPISDPPVSQVLTSSGLPWMQIPPPWPLPCGNIGFFPGYDKNNPTCCQPSCHQGPAPGHLHCVCPPDCECCP